MTSAYPWQGLLTNFAILAMLVLAWAYFQDLVSRLPKLLRDAAFGALMGLGAAMVMHFAIEVREGILFDLRTVAVALAGIFGGPVAAIVAVAVAAVQRILIGGGGVPVGVLTLVVAGVVGVGARAIRGDKPITGRYLVACGFVVALVAVSGLFLLRDGLWITNFGSMVAPLAIVAFTAFTVGGMITIENAQRRQLRAAFDKTQAQFGYALAEMSDGIAMFDAGKRLVFSNEQYRDFFPLTRDVRVPGAHFHDILIAVVARGEQIGRPQTDSREWMDETVARLDSSSEEEVQLLDGRWLSLRTRPAADGSCMVVVSDLTARKNAERSLKDMTVRLQLLAVTDALTGIGNRRAFDDALARETAAAAISLAPLSMLLVDIDWFKSFNDEYGHPVGDRCLKAIARTLHSVLRGPSDFVARFGGEEFVVHLPGASLDRAFEVSETFAAALQKRGIEHNGSPLGVVTASVGVASWSAADGLAALADLVPDADRALYRAKQSGRNRISKASRLVTVVAGAA